MNVQRPVAPPPELILPGRTGLYYGGAWHAPKSGRHVEVISPATGQVLCSIADAGP